MEEIKWNITSKPEFGHEQKSLISPEKLKLKVSKQSNIEIKMAARTRCR